MTTTTTNDYYYNDRITFKWHQDIPRKHCEYRTRGTLGKCRNPRCSLDCRSNYAEMECLLVLRQLSLLPPNIFVFFGNLKTHADLHPEDVKQIRKRFKLGVKQMAQQHNGICQFACYTEIGEDDLQLHDHFVCYSTFILTQGQLKEVWNEACGGLKTTVKCDPPMKSKKAAVKYLTKDLNRFRSYERFIRLFMPGTINQTWQSGKFFTNGKKNEWKWMKARWKAASGS